MKRTRAYWPTRVILAVGIGVALVDLVAAVGALTAPPCFSCMAPAVLGLPSGLLMPALGALLAVVGLIWMVRIFRGPRDEPPAWRYRDRR